MYNVKRNWLPSLVLRAAVIMWERKNNQQQEMAVRETIKAIKANANALVERMANCMGTGCNMEVMKKRYIKHKIRQLKRGCCCI